MDEIKYDRFGSPFYDKMPENYKKASTNDFHRFGKVIIGKKYLIHTFHSGVFELHIISEKTRSKDLMEFFNLERIYVEQ